MGWLTALTKEEDAILRSVYPVAGWREVVRLTGRPRSGVYQMACKLNIKLNDDVRSAAHKPASSASSYDSL